MRNQERVAKIMARRGMCSRREAERLIAAGQVVVDGAPVTVQGTRCRHDSRIELGATGRRWMDRRLSILVHKPAGIVSTQPEGDQVPAWRLLRRDNHHGHAGHADPAAVARVLRHPYYLHVCGRLDRESRGLLVCSQDGTVARRITGTSLPKRYLVRVDRRVDRRLVERLRALRFLDGRPLKAMGVRSRGGERLEFTLREGRRHQIRRACREVGCEVVDLLRTAIGPWELGDLPEGWWRVLDADEAGRLGSSQ